MKQNEVVNSAGNLLFEVEEVNKMISSDESMQDVNRFTYGDGFLTIICC